MQMLVRDFAVNALSSSTSSSTSLGISLIRDKRAWSMRSLRLLAVVGSVYATLRRQQQQDCQ
eukprot:894531-Rhodomonas_salina.1